MIPTRERPPNRTEHERNIRHYQWITAMEAVFSCALPAYVPLWKGSGLTMSEIFLLQGLFALAIVLTEVPTGYVADILGRRRSLVIGCVLVSLSSIIYICANSFMTFLVGELLVGVGFSFRSGADTAILYESLKQRGRSHEYLAITAQAGSRFLLLCALATVTGGVLSSIDVRLPLVAIAIVSILQFWSAVGMTEPTGLVRSHHPYLQEILSVARVTFAHDTRVRWLAMPPAIIGGALIVSLWLYQPTFERVGIPMEFIGALFAIQSLVAAIGARIAPRLGRAHSEGSIVLFSIFTMSVGYLGMASESALVSVGGGMILQLVRVIPSTLFGEALQHVINSDRRATVLSLVSMLGRLSGCAGMLIVTGLALFCTDQQVLAIWGVGSACAIAIIVWLLIPREGVAEASELLESRPAAE